MTAPVDQELRKQVEEIVCAAMTDGGTSWDYVDHILALTTRAAPQEGEPPLEIDVARVLTEVWPGRNMDDCLTHVGSDALTRVQLRLKKGGWLERACADTSERADALPEWKRELVIAKDAASRDRAAEPSGAPRREPPPYLEPTPAHTGGPDGPAVRYPEPAPPENQQP